MQKLMLYASGLIFVVAAACAVGLIVSWPLSLLWNLCLVPAIPVLKEVGVLQMWGIVVLFGFLFKPTISTSK